ncbi:Calcipressin [Rhizopogon vinicolor AM-OR11-026]|uniref:Calcipressin n=1 Tax=Rhizopogon vinicolor AM-OR11-026 TaxID=1314800 RepID=A0A1B7MTX5_9AGAM|nr:Calcipressin [Rhizopogon vinicolor AM-OR11-026]
MPDISILTHHSNSLTSPQPVQPTNSLVITQVPRTFFQPSILNVLRDHFATYGEINQWVPIASFARIILVYFSEDSAELAKHACDPLILTPPHRMPTILRVYRSEPNPIFSPSSPTSDENFLRPPPIEKNFLISPPGSPPIGWEQIREDPPNATPLADDLIVALRKLKMQERRSSREVLLEPEDGGVGVYVEDCDFDEGDHSADEMDWEYGSPSPVQLRWKPIATAMPPLQVR